MRQAINGAAQQAVWVDRGTSQRDLRDLPFRMPAAIPTGLSTRRSAAELVYVPAILARSSA
jgi:hypothetical protein